VGFLQKATNANVLLDRKYDMGFRLQIQADYGGEMLVNVHPERKGSGGKAVLAFLIGLHNHCAGEKFIEDGPIMQEVSEWYRRLEQAYGSPFYSGCRSLLDCMWSDGGDQTEYHEDEYEFFRKRSPGLGDGFTMSDFQKWVAESRERWKPISEVISGVRIILKVFTRSEVEPLDGFYEPQYTELDFEALLSNLELLAERGNTVVRLRFF
jgi:hypothetical protein